MNAIGRVMSLSGWCTAMSGCLASPQPLNQKVLGLKSKRITKLALLPRVRTDVRKCLKAIRPTKLALLPRVRTDVRKCLKAIRPTKLALLPRVRTDVRKYD